MAIYRLSIEVLQGERDGDNAESRAAAVATLNDLKASLQNVEGVHVYSEDEAAPWGVPTRPDTFNLDFDSKDHDERQIDAECMDEVTAFVLDRS